MATLLSTVRARLQTTREPASNLKVPRNALRPCASILGNSEPLPYDKLEEENENIEKVIAQMSAELEELRNRLDDAAAEGDFDDIDDQDIESGINPDVEALATELRKIADSVPPPQASACPFGESDDLLGELRRKLITEPALEALDRDQELATKIAENTKQKGSKRKAANKAPVEESPWKVMRSLPLVPNFLQSALKRRQELLGLPLDPDM